MTRPSKALIDLAALRSNYLTARNLHGGRALAVVKANAYGHGAVPCAQALADIADGFEAHAGDFQRGVDQDAALFAAADDGHVDLVGPRGVGAAGDVGSRGDEGAELGARAQEIAAGEGGGKAVGHGRSGRCGPGPVIRARGRNGCIGQGGDRRRRE